MLSLPNLLLFALVLGVGLGGGGIGLAATDSGIGWHTGLGSLACYRLGLQPARRIGIEVGSAAPGYVRGEQSLGFFGLPYQSRFRGQQIAYKRVRPQVWRVGVVQ